MSASVPNDIGQYRARRPPAPNAHAHVGRRRDGPVYFPSGAYNLGMFTLRAKSSASISAGKLHRSYKDLSEAVTQAEETLFDYQEITSIEVCDGDRVVTEVRRDSNGKIDKPMF
jgi:hypothetical protein